MSVGGEKRRVSIGCELLTRPGLLLLDEPTTGLDSTNAARVVDILAALSGSRGGVTVLLSIHQPRPDIFRLMDRVMLLSGEGQVRQGSGASWLLLLSGEGQVRGRQPLGLAGRGRTSIGGGPHIDAPRGPHRPSLQLFSPRPFYQVLCNGLRWTLRGPRLNPKTAMGRPSS